VRLEEQVINISHNMFLLMAALASKSKDRVYRSTPPSSERWPSCWVSLPRTQMYSSSIYGGLHSHLRNQVMFFKPRTVDEACVHAQYLENIGHKKGKPSGCKDPSNHCNHCNIDGNTEEKCWKLHPELNSKNHKKDAKKKNLLATYSEIRLKETLMWMRILFAHQCIRR
jgi:hypothetical protein